MSHTFWSKRYVSPLSRCDLGGSAADWIARSKTKIDQERIRAEQRRKMLDEVDELATQVHS